VVIRLSGEAALAGLWERSFRHGERPAPPVGWIFEFAVFYFRNNKRFLPPED
jgi:hypothetical protein